MVFCIQSTEAMALLILLFPFIMSAVVALPATNTRAFSYNVFPTSEANAPNLKYSGIGRPYYGAAQVSMDTANAKAKTASWGWVVQNEKLQFKPRDGNNHRAGAAATEEEESASFNTSFQMNIQVNENNRGVGGGVAFMLAPYGQEHDEADSRTGKWLGLYNESSDRQRSNNIIAVEFDTYEDEFDPDSNHVGLDLNGIQSFRTQPLIKYSINLSANSNNFTVWIDYDGLGKRLDVSMAHSNVNPASKHDAKNVLSVADINLGNYTSDVVYAGFAASSGDAIDLHCLLAWNFSMACFPTPTDNRLEIGLIVAVTAAALIGIIAITLFIRRRNRKRRATDSRLARMELGSLKSSGPRRFSYRELSKATRNFSKNNKLGSGASGTVYRATLYDKTVVAVKRISCEGVKEFVSEVSSISRLRHRNILPLLGWSFHHNSDDELLLVYQYMPKGSLDQWIFAPAPLEGHASLVILNWAQRYKVLCGTASALAYLHEGWEQTVIHRDVKASNIMLDSDFTPRLGDFGLARVTEHGLSQLETMNLGGTPGYMAPEMLDTWMVTKQADVYSFGMVVLEVVCGRRPIYREKEQGKFLLEWVWELYEGGKLAEAVDSRLEQGSYDEEDTERALKVGLLCANPNMMQRPPMSLVLQELTTKGSSTFNLPLSMPKYYRPHLPNSSLPRLTLPPPLASPPPPSSSSSVVSISTQDGNPPSSSSSSTSMSISIAQQVQLSQLIPR